MNIPFFDYPAVFNDFKDEFVNEFIRVGERGAFISQDELTKFENELSIFTGVKYAIGVANATDALELLLCAAGLENGDEVLVSAHTMVATAGAVKMFGGVPVPVDIGDDRNIDVAEIEKNITSKTKFIMPTHLNGRLANMREIIKLAEKYDLKIVEDGAQSLGARLEGDHSGSFGVGGCISFYPAKVLGCLGDGGAVLTNNESIAKSIRAMRDHGRTDFGVYENWGRNSRLDNLQAAFLSVQFPRYPKVIERRREIAHMYNEGLSDIAQISLPPLDRNTPQNKDIFQNYEVLCENRDGLKTWLSDNQIGTLIQWGGMGINNLQSLGIDIPLPNSDRFFERCLMLPMNYSINDYQVKRVISAIREFYS